MARKSRKVVASAPSQPPAPIQRTRYQAGLYARISVENERKREADSIGTQIQLLKDFAENNDIPIDDIYVDFKHWTGNVDKDRDKEIERFVGKLDKINGKLGFVINILKPENYNPEQYIGNDKRLIIIPYLYDPETEKLNMKAFETIIRNVENKI